MSARGPHLGPPATPFALQTRGLSKTYGKGEAQVEALRGIDLDIRIGEFTSIMGPSGSGKSTLLHLIGLLDGPTAGAIRIMGQDASHFNAKQRALARRRNLGFVFQAFHLMPRVSAIQNVMLPMALAGVPRRTRIPRAQAILKALGIADRAGHKPSELSGGQKQRVAIARALALDPPIILADEPTGNLDSATSQQIMHLFQDLNRRGKTIIQVTHAPDMARFGRRIVRVHDGLLEPPAAPGPAGPRATGAQGMPSGHGGHVPGGPARSGAHSGSASAPASVAPRRAPMPGHDAHVPRPPHGDIPADRRWS